MPKSQKASGLMALQNWAALSPLPAITLTAPSPSATWDMKHRQTVLHWVGHDLHVFVRPCPLSPAHGFVESRPIALDKAVTAEQFYKELDAKLADIWAETRAADPDGELLLTPFIPADLNLIWRPGVVTVGPGHDGATSGRKSLAIPAPMFTPAYYNSTDYDTLYTDAKITDTPYIEAVRVGPGHRPYVSSARHLHRNDGYGGVVLTQIRNGPNKGTRADFIPHPITVETIIQPNGEDLLGWKARIESIANPQTLVVYHPGGNCSDHYFVHCVANNVAVLTTRCPALGETLVASPPLPYEPRAALRGLITGLLAPLGTERDRRQAVLAVAHLLHSAGHIEGVQSYWIGVATMLMVRLGYAAALGEYRHSYRSGELRARSRCSVYDQALCGPTGYFENRGTIDQAWASFHYGKWTTGYGGTAWAACTNETITLERLLIELVQEQTTEHVSRVVAQLNVVVNLAHNNGWWLNKFVVHESFNNAAHGEPAHILRSSAFLYDSHVKSHEAALPWMSLVRRLRRLRPLTPLVVEPRAISPTAPPFPEATLTTRLHDTLFDPDGITVHVRQVGLTLHIQIPLLRDLSLLALTSAHADARASFASLTTLRLDIAHSLPPSMDPGMNLHQLRCFGNSDTPLEPVFARIEALKAAHGVPSWTTGLTDCYINGLVRLTRNDDGSGTFGLWLPDTAHDAPPDVTVEIPDLQDETLDALTSVMVRRTKSYFYNIMESQSTLTYDAQDLRDVRARYGFNLADGSALTMMQPSADEESDTDEDDEDNENDQIDA